MKREDALTIFVTFLLGFFVGGYLYLTNAASLVAKLSTPTAEQPSRLMIVGDAYGSCRSVCPSFRVSHDGSYSYVYTPSAGAEQIVQKGTIPRSLMRELRSTLTKAALTRQSRPIQPAFCNSYTDGIDVVYEITLDGELYLLDSCGTDVDGEGSVWITLSKVWTYYETGRNN